MEKAKGIEVNQKIMFGKPVIAGTRIPVEVILDKLGAGIQVEEILEDYPRLNRDDIRKVVEYANNLVKKVSSDHARSSL